MDASGKKLEVALLALPEATASTLYGMQDLLASVGRDWDYLVNGRPGVPKVRPFIVSADGAAFDAFNGLRVQPHASLRDGPEADVVCLPDFFVAPDDDIGGRYDAEIAWLKERFAAGATLAASCTGALVFAEAGLLDGLEATTHWGYCDALAARYPKVAVRGSRALVVTGEEGRIVMAGGGTSWLDLGLYLIARFLGVEEAMRTAKLHLIDWHDLGQQPFAVLSRARQSSDAVIASCQEWAAEHYGERNPVAAMERLSGLAGRSFKRRFTKATGMPPMAYVHTIRLEESKQMLETTDLPVEAVANEVGYEDASFFSRLFRRKVGVTPAQYRKRFSTLRRALEASGPDEPSREAAAPALPGIARRPISALRS